MFHAVLILTLALVSSKASPLASSTNSVSSSAPVQQAIIFSAPATQFQKKEESRASERASSRGNAVVTRLPSVFHRNFVVTPSSSRPQSTTSFVTGPQSTFTTISASPTSGPSEIKDESLSVIHRRNVINSRLRSQNNQNVIIQSTNQANRYNPQLGRLNIVSHANRVVSSGIAGAGHSNTLKTQTRNPENPQTVINQWQNPGGSRTVFPSPQVFTNQRSGAGVTSQTRDGSVHRNAVVVSPSSATVASGVLTRAPAVKVSGTTDNVPSPATVTGTSVGHPGGNNDALSRPSVIPPAENQNSQ